MSLSSCINPAQLSTQPESLTYSAIAAADQVFCSTHQHILSQGVHTILHQPVFDLQHSPAAFLQQVQQAFSSARAAGQSNPLCIGVLPFDLHEPAYLVIPEHVQRYHQTPLALTEPGRSARLPLQAIESNFQQAQFERAVRQAQANFSFSDLRKVVLGRILRVQAQQDFNRDQIFQHLLWQNPQAYHYRIALPEQKVLLGASPELLLRKQQNNVLSHPLAGSRKRLSIAHDDQLQAQELRASLKDHFEHSLVTRAIEQVLQPLCAKLQVPKLPDLFATSTMWHLATAIEGELQQTAMTALELALRLHPTPALGGYPSVPANKLIQLIEPESRAYFGGLVGWCDANGDGEWAVVIRGGEIQGCHARLFAGAGIVDESVPEAEWLETKAKLQTMLNALQLDLQSGPQAASLQEAA